MTLLEEKTTEFATTRNIADDVLLFNRKGRFVKGRSREKQDQCLIEAAVDIRKEDRKK